MLERCKKSVQAQTVKVEHRIGIDSDRRGPQISRNLLAKDVETEWILSLDDDDELDPDFVERLLSSDTKGDIIYPWCRTNPIDSPMSMIVNKLFSPQALFKMNFIPCTALIRTDAFKMLGGYRLVSLEDWDLWQRAFLHGLNFRCVPEVLWTYHFAHGSNTFQRAA